MSKFDEYMLPGQLTIFDLFGDFDKKDKPKEKTPFDYLYDSILLGTGFQDGKKRVYEAFKSGLKGTEFVKFIKKEFGIGGSSFWWGAKVGEICGRDCGCVYKKGFDYSVTVKTCEDIDKDPREKFYFKWSEVADAIIKAIENGDYIKELVKVAA